MLICWNPKWQQKKLESLSFCVHSQDIQYSTLLCTKGKFLDTSFTDSLILRYHAWCSLSKYAWIHEVLCSTSHFSFFSFAKVASKLKKWCWFTYKNQQKKLVTKRNQRHDRTVPSLLSLLLFSQTDLWSPSLHQRF